MALLEFKPEGIWCSQGDFYIDPWRKVKNALITHAHSDHARWGMGSYLAHRTSVPVLKQRLGLNINVESCEYGETFNINGVKISFHPAGHIPGSAQIRVEYKGEIWVVSGDYKVQEDGISTPFEPVKCHTFISECTFGLPLFKWQDPQIVFNKINSWWQNNALNKVASVIAGYPLGKSQRIIAGVDGSLGPILVQQSVFQTMESLAKGGVNLPKVEVLSAAANKETVAGALIVVTPSYLNNPIWNRFEPVSTASASGWMALRGARRRAALDRGFVLSDHADWPGLQQAIAATGAENIILTHGYTAPFSRWLKEKGYNAIEHFTEFAAEGAEPEPALEHDKPDLIV